MQQSRFNMGIQDLLPTWQWWMEPMSGSLDRSILKFEPLVVQYDKSLVFHGGASFHISGELRSNDGVALRLFKMKVPMQSGTDSTSIHIVWHGTEVTRKQLQLGLVFEDQAGQAEWIRFDEKARMTHEMLHGGWVRSRINLTAYHGRTVAALLLGFKPGSHHKEAATVAIHIGELYIGRTSEETPLPRPSGFTIESHAVGVKPDSVQVRLRWKMDETTRHYDLFCVSQKWNARTWLGRVSGDCYYAANVDVGEQNAITFELVATARKSPSLRSLPAQTVLHIRV
jgi:hypothetical protein